MRVLAYDPFVYPARAQLYHAQLVDLEKLLREADIISIHCPLTPRTWHLIGTEQLKLLKSTAILVNTARGAVIDEKALIEALEKEQLFGAGLDVFEEEPLNPASPLRRLENVVLTPHLAYATKKAVRNTWIGAVGNILRFIKGEKPNWILNPTILSKRE
jgi:phosphoglycerate dehydrogenase-like enzyme